MNEAKNQRMVDNYFRYMRHWDTSSKKDIIIKLTESIDSNPVEKSDFSSCFGAWVDRRSADEIIRDIRVDRVNNNEIEEF